MEQVAKIPFGKSRSYKDIAIAIDAPKAARAIGRVCGSNPFPLFIPCHRVIAANGRLSGFSFGLSIKKELINLEKTLT